ncbi:uncharacterized protein LOC118356902 [Zalophus californianus]|uniref:Uncharacterized protein LOC118356902 n=1 Tax=Zalophus californianus TaxID=9704 RepID=A0A6P9FKW6_ZALCA|nr:uncharacterized protein LOC118356902 [Zalophus californianus]
MFQETLATAARFLMTEPEKSQPVLSIVYSQPRLKARGKRSLLSKEVVGKILQPSSCTLETFGRCLARRNYSEVSCQDFPLRPLPVPVDHPRCFPVWPPWNGMPPPLGTWPRGHPQSMVPRSKSQVPQDNPQKLACLLGPTLQKSRSVASTVITSLPELRGRNLRSMPPSGDSQSPMTQRAAFEKREMGNWMSQDLVGNIDTIPVVNSIAHKTMGPDK